MARISIEMSPPLFPAITEPHLLLYSLPPSSRTRPSPALFPATLPRPRPPRHACSTLQLPATPQPPRHAPPQHCFPPLRHGHAPHATPAVHFNCPPPPTPQPPRHAPPPYTSHLHSFQRSTQPQSLIDSHGSNISLLPYIHIQDCEWVCQNTCDIQSSILL